MGVYGREERIIPLQSDPEEKYDHSDENRCTIEPPLRKFRVQAPVSDQDVTDGNGSQAVGDVDVIFLESTRECGACEIAHHEIDRKREDVFPCAAEMPDSFEEIVTRVIALDKEVERDDKEECDDW